MSTRRTIAERIEAELNRKKKMEEEIKGLLQQQKKEERKARTHRLSVRAGMLEGLLPDTIKLSDVRFNAFLRKTTANDFGRRVLSDLVAEQAKEDASNRTDGGKTEGGADTAQGGGTAAAKPAQTPTTPSVADGGRTGVTDVTGA